MTAKGASWARRSPMVRAGTFRLADRTSVKAIAETWVPKRITASTSASECTGLSGSIGRYRESRSLTGFETSVAAIKPVTMYPMSTPAGLRGPLAGPVSSNAPRRKVAPAVKPARTAVTCGAQRLPITALAVITSGSGVSSVTACSAASRNRLSVRPESPPSAIRRRRQRLGPRACALGFEDGPDQVQWDREDDGGVLLDADLDQRLKESKLERALLRGDYLGGVGQRLRRLELTVCVDDLRPLLPLGLGLLGHRSLHRAGQLHVLDLDARHLDAPRLGFVVDDLLQRLVDDVALRQQLVEGGLAQDRTKRGLRDLGRRVDVVQHLDNRAPCVDDLEVEDRVDLGGHVVLGDDLLRRHLERDHAQVDPDDPVDPERDDEIQAGPFEPDEATESEHHSAVVLVRDAQARKNDDQDQQYEDAEDDESAGVHLYFSFCSWPFGSTVAVSRGTTSSRSPVRPTTLTGVPAWIASPDVVAFHS